MRSNRFIEAFRESYNVVGLASVTALSFALLNPVPLLAGIVAEAVYLLFVPDTKWYEARLAKRFDAEVVRRREELKAQTLPTLGPEMQARFGRLERMRAQIEGQAAEGQDWYQEVLRKLDFLLEKFLHFATREAQFRAYLLSVYREVTGEAQREERRDAAGPGANGPRKRDTERDDPGWRTVDRRGGGRRDRETERPPAGRSDPAGRPDPVVPVDGDEQWVREMVQRVSDSYGRQIEDLTKLKDAEQDESTKAVLEKRLEVLQRRQEFVGKIGQIQTNLYHQLQLVEDTFGLINDEIRARSPEQVLADIEDVVWQTNTMTQVLEQIAPYEQMAARLSV